MISPNTNPAATDTTVHADSQNTIWSKVTVPPGWVLASTPIGGEMSGLE
jgi:hypothetical protein